MVPEASICALTLLVSNVVLCASNDTRVLNALDRLGHSNTSQIRVRRETFPVAATCRHATDGSRNRTENYL